MTAKRQLLCVWPFLLLLEICLGFWDSWRPRDFASIGIIMVIGILLLVMSRAQRSQP